MKKKTTLLDFGVLWDLYMFPKCKRMLGVVADVARFLFICLFGKSMFCYYIKLLCMCVFVCVCELDGLTQTATDIPFL